MADDDKLDRILALLEVQGRTLDAHSRELDAIHVLMAQQATALATTNTTLSNYGLMFERILTRLEAMGHRIEDIENRIAGR